MPALALGSFRTRQQEGGLPLSLGLRAYSSWSSRCWVIFPLGQESHWTPHFSPPSHPGLHTAGAQRALPLDRERKPRAHGKKRLLGEGLELMKAECEGTFLCFHLRITSYLSLNSPRVFLLGLRPQECSVQEGWDQASTAGHPTKGNQGPAGH